MRNGCSAPSASKEKSFLHSSTSLLYYSVGKKEKGADGKFEAVPVVAAVKAWVAHRLSWRVCVVQALSHITTTPHGVTGLLSSVSMQRWEVGSKRRQSFSPSGKKNREKIHSLLSSLTNSVSPADQLPCVTVVSQVKSSMSLPLPFQTTLTPFGSKCCTLNRRFVHFWRSPQLAGQVPLPAYLCRCILLQGESRQVQPTLWGSCGGKWTSM